MVTTYFIVIDLNEFLLYYAFLRVFKKGDTDELRQNCFFSDYGFFTFA